MDKAKFSESGYLSNMLYFPVNKEEVRLNPTMKDLVINRPAAKKKRRKWHKKEESTAEMVESVGENQ
jgi:hypothetical protein